MYAAKADIIHRLQKDILPLQGFKSSKTTATNIDLGLINHAFPNAEFPLGAVHEFLCADSEALSVSTGFIAGILSALMRSEGVSLWISACRKLFPPALRSFGIEPDKVIFIDLHNQKDVLWVMEEALKCNGLAAVICEIKEVSFISSRRLQLAVEQSRVTGFVIHHNLHTTTSAFVTRWRVTSLPSITRDIPGVGFPCWNVELLKVRNGKPGSWQLEWFAGGFRHVLQPSTYTEQLRKTG